MSERKIAESEPGRPNTARRAMLTGGAVGLAAVAGSALGRTPSASAAVNEPTPDWINVTNSSYAGGAVGNGTHDDTLAIQTAASQVPSGGVLYLPVGTYKTTGTITLGYDVRMVGDGSGSVIEYYGSGDAVRQYNTSRPPYSTTDFSGGVEDLLIDGTNSTGAACGLHIGDGSDYYLNRVRIANFTGAGAIGLHLDNTVGWTEKMTATVQLFRNTTAVVFDVNNSAGGPPAGTGVQSFMYNDFDFHISADEINQQGQQGVSMLNGAFIQNARFKIRGNFFYSSKNAFNEVVSCLDVSGSDNSGNYCHISNSFVDIAVETDNVDKYSNVSGWQTVKFGSNQSNYMNSNLGLMVFLDSWWTNSDASGGQFSLDGLVQGDSNLAAVNTYLPGFPGQLLCPTTNYAPTGTPASPSVSTGTLTSFDTNNITTGAFNAPPSGNVLITASFMGQPSVAGLYVAFGLIGHSGGQVHGDVQVVYFPSSSGVTPVTLQFLVALNAGQSYQFDLAGAVAANSFAILAYGQTVKSPIISAAGAGGPVTLTVAGA